MLRECDFLQYTKQTNWNEVFHLATIHGVGAIALDGIQKFYDEQKPLNIDLQT